MIYFQIIINITVILIVSIIAADDYVKNYKTIIFKDEKFIHNNNYQSIENNLNHYDVEDDNTNKNNEISFNKQCNGWPNIPINGDIKCYSNSGCIARCKSSYQFPNGESQITISCNQKKWQIIGTKWTTIPNCEPICLPKCQNNGICISPNECKCQENFSGHRCQFEKIPCLNDPPPVQNSQRSCNSKICTIACLNKFVFSDGSSIANLICQNGNWVPTRSDWVSIPDCTPTCTPPCENGGICLTLNVCQCPNDFRGPQCQYLTEACSTKNLGFNGGYECSGDENIFSCVLNCPIGVNFTSPPASKYICSYETGIFEPQPIPQCKVTTNFQIIPIESIKNTFYKISNHSWTIEGVSSSNTNFYEVENNMNGLFNNFLNDKYNNDETEFKLIHRDTKIKKKLWESKVCFTWGGIHFKTFDGAVYSFDNNCTYILVQETQNEIFMITIQNSEGCSNGNNCYRILKIYLQKEEYILHLNHHGYPEFRTSKKILPIPSQLLGMQVKMSAHFVLVSLDFVGINIKWDGKLFIEVKSSESLWNRTAGLCGRMNGDPSDDIINRDYTYPKNIATFISSWKVLNIEEICDESIDLSYTCNSRENLATQAKKFCTELFSDKRFQVCSKSIFLMPFHHTCELDFCGCKDKDKRKCACETMSIYVRQCFHDQLIKSIDWRLDNLCPMECTGGRIYKSCGPQKQLSCNTQFSELTTDDSYCEEGCFCPKNTVLHEGKCILIDECPCTLRGKLFKPGDSILKNCNTCTCSSGKWICTEVMCRATCTAIGDPHYVTFDKKHYDFMGKCNYYLVKGDNYSIETENIACSGGISESMGLSKITLMDQPSCTKSITIRLENHSIKLKQNHQILINGEDVTKLPVSAFGAKIRVASSIFIVVNIMNGIEIWWDGISQIYVNVPPAFRGKTKGLCGTFNGNQKDDFLTPFGDIEQSIISFANKWKTSEQCNDLTKIEFTHPCDKNPERYITADKYCSKIFDSTFSNCHWHVDPEQFYQDCKYDMCACESSIDRCLCPNFAAYAKECAVSGINIFWRTQFQECQLHCPNGQKYQICGNSCTRSCYDISFYQDCHQECIEGCNCPEGQTLNTQGECILIGQCPCQYNGIEYNAGYREIRPGRKSEELCTCGGGIWTCHPATLDEINEYPKVTNLKTLCGATKNLEVTYCEPEEPKTCLNMHKLINQQSPAICRPGCICKKGYVLNHLNGVCIEEKMCPCYHGGKSFKEGATMQEDCNTCTCINGNWKCTKQICRGICTAWGDSHYKTFDDKIYDFQGICNYVLVKGSLGDFENFYVSIQNVPCGSVGVSCSKSVTLCVNNVDNKECITLTRGKPISTISFEKIFIRKAGLFIFLDVPNLGLVLQWDQGTRVYVKLDPKWKGRTQGLCGDYNDNNEDDFKTPSGGIAEVSAHIFGNSWREDNYCPEVINISDTCILHPERKVWAIEKCGILKSFLFQPCHYEVNIEPYIQRCLFDTCGCDGGGDCECLCTALAAYTYECNEKGISLKWRSQELCPIQCNENFNTYSSCISACPHQTCDNLLMNNHEISLCTQDTCVEGCTLKSCPEGEVYQNSSLKNCVPKITCKPYCNNINGILYYEGDQVSSDACHTCFCSRKKLVCNGVPCQLTKTNDLTTIPMEEPIKCIDGWTNWLNKNIKKLSQNNESEEIIFSDVESLPSILDLLNLENSTRCSKEEMVDIECRTVSSHKHPDETDLNLECNIKNGLVCQSSNNLLPCEDFEIRVLCQCNHQYLPITLTSPYLISTTVASAIFTESSIDNCSIKDPNQPHSTDCHSFYQCISTSTGTKLVEKICEIGTMYNPETQTCDWPYNVIKLRPECGQIKKITKISNHCQEGEIWNDCAIKCNQTCLNYYHILVEQNICVSFFSCVPGCVNNTEYSNCPSHKFWRDSHSCVDIFDCPCITHNNTIIKPGIVVAESECERCQCLSNYYTCDKSLCKTPIIPTSPPVVSSVTTFMTDYSEMIAPSTISSVEQCLNNNYKSLLSNSEIDGILFNASSVAGSNYLPKYAGFTDFDKNSISSNFSVWQPKLIDSNQWLEIEFPQPMSIYGIIMKGNFLENKYVTSYRVLYSLDGHTFSFIFNNKKELVFRGPIDSLMPMKELLAEPIKAKIIRINPQTWYHGIAIKLDLLGCENISTTENVFSTTLSSMTSIEDKSTTIISPFSTVYPYIHEENQNKPICNDSMGLDNGFMSENQITASSAHENLIFNLQLSSKKIWKPILDNPHQYIQFDFLQHRNLTGIMIKGLNNIWTVAYKLFYGNDIYHWNPVMDKLGNEKIYFGNFDDVTVNTNYFDKPISARYLKIQPVKWHNHIGLKIEILGCFIPYPPINDVYPIKILEFKSKCNICHEVFQESLKNINCKCNNTLWWNGEYCVEKHKCPCVVDNVLYSVGTSFETNNCQKCLCAMGGIPECHLKICPSCNDGNMQSVVTEICGCACKPCPADTVLCSSTNICIEKSAWCNGVKDCLDDETNCTIDIVESSKNMTKNTTTVVIVTTTEIKNVTKFQCENPVCPSGYKPILLESSKIRNTYYSSLNERKISEKKNTYKVTKNNHRIAKEPRKNGNINHENDSNRNVPCQPFSCKPHNFSLNLSVGNKSSNECHKIQCPSNYQIIYEPTSMYELIPCPKYTCKPLLPKENICNVVGRTFITFDNLEYKYDICNHILVREMFHNLWYITLEKHCTQKNNLCTKVLAIVIDTDVIVLHPNMHVDVNDYTYTKQQLDYLKNRYTSFKICTVGNFIHFISYIYQFWIIWDENSNVKIGIPETLVYHIDGLCGYYDKLIENDQQKPDGSQAFTIKEFGDSWAMDGTPECTKQNCSFHILDISKKICNTLKDRSFSMCNNVMNIDKYILRCLEITCICLNENRTVDDCRCRALSSFTVECQSRDFTFDLSTWRSIHNCSVYCPLPFIYKDCFRNKCEMTCQNLQEVDPCPIMDVCFSGCFCPDNLIRNNNSCITASECRDCKCNHFGNSNLINFNRNNFTFMGNCTYILSQDTIKHIDNKVEKHIYQILMTNIPCFKGICIEALSVLYKGHFLQIEQKFYTKNFISTLDGEPLEIPFKNSWISLTKSDNKDITLLIPAIQLEINIYWHNFAFIISLSSHIFGGAIEGLCGTCHLNNDDDDKGFIKSNGELTKNVNEFGASWLAIGMPEVRFSHSEDCSVQPVKNCTLPVSNEDPCQILLNTNAFGHCHGLIDPEPFLQSCHDTLCEHGNFCGDLEYYAQKCREVGLCPKWRTDNLCPFNCPNYLKYQPCGSCPRTCNNLNDNTQMEEYKCDNNNIEGCFCPENFVLHNSTCIPEKDCFICDNQGHIDGDVWNIDKCTLCYCHNKVISCEKKECQALDAICEQNFIPMVVPGTENECCIKYLCVPISTNSPSTCVEPQQPECGYGQTMKLIIGNDGCQKFICQCLPLEECPLIMDNMSAEVEKVNYQEGYISIVNTTGCCPRSTLVCQPDTCPLPPKCPEYHDLKVYEIPSGCCSTYNCEPKQNICLYTPEIDHMNGEKVIIMQVNETWRNGPCNVCTCEKSSNKYPTAVCITTKCLNLDNHPDLNDYILKENNITDQCCPQIQRFACKHNEKIINVGEEWHLDTNDSCISIKCENTSFGIEKKVFYQPCQSLCKKGYEYKSSNNGGSHCCGECIATSCVVNNSLKDIGEKWHSDDFCIYYECLFNNDNHTQIKELNVQCDVLDPLENEEYVIETVSVSGNCCPKYIRKACKSNGKIYNPGVSWKNELNDCLMENCVSINYERVEIQKTVQNCNISCEIGWEYQNPEKGQCCGKCKQIFCVYDGTLYKPYSIWFSEDNCTRYECQYHNDQFIVSVSSPVCRDISTCPLENIYNDGCCDICNVTSLDFQKLCLVEVLEPDVTIGIISEKRGKHGICYNSQEIIGITECHGTCSSSTYFNSSTGIQEINCQCCKPTKMKEIIIDLICEDKQVLPKTIYVPAACSCFKCQSLQ